MMLRFTGDLLVPVVSVSPHLCLVMDPLVSEGKLVESVPLGGCLVVGKRSVVLTEPDVVLCVTCGVCWGHRDPGVTCGAVTPPKILILVLGCSVAREPSLVVA